MIHLNTISRNPPVLSVINHYQVGIALPNSNLTLPRASHGAASVGNATAISSFPAAARPEAGRTEPAAKRARTVSELSSAGRAPEDLRRGRRPGEGNDIHGIRPGSFTDNADHVAGEWDCVGDAHAADQPQG